MLFDFVKYCFNSVGALTCETEGTHVLHGLVRGGESCTKSKPVVYTQVI